MSCRLLREDLIKIYYKDPNKCLHCENIIHVTEKIKIADLRNRKFCSSSCSSLYHFKLRREQGKRNKSYGTGLKYYCDCGEIRSRRAKTCRKCLRKLNGLGERSLEEMLKSYIRIEQAYIAIRKHSRSSYLKSDKPKKCIKCGYDKHYQICHIKPIKDFKRNSLIKEINDLSNLVALCPNCHWEFDNDLLKL